MSAVARFDLKMDVEEKEVISRAAALVGTTMAAFVRMAAKEYAVTERRCIQGGLTPAYSDHQG
ncbi:MAG: DUF1778 domain-containing protein [Ferrovum myxofaciens]